MAACRPAADLWSLIWAKVDDLGGSGISVAKVKAHATEADVQAGCTTALHRAGNDHADHFAKRGSALAEHLSSTASSRNVPHGQKMVPMAGGTHLKLAR